MDGYVDTAAPQKSAVGCIDDRIDFQARDVPLADFDFTANGRYQCDDPAFVVELKVI